MVSSASQAPHELAEEVNKECGDSTVDTQASSSSHAPHEVTEEVHEECSDSAASSLSQAALSATEEVQEECGDSTVDTQAPHEATEEVDDECDDSELDTQVDVEADVEGASFFFGDASDRLSDISDVLAARTDFVWQEGADALTEVSNWSEEYVNTAVQYFRLAKALSNDKLLFKTEVTVDDSRTVADNIAGASDSLQEIYSDVGEGYLAACEVARDWLSIPKAPRRASICRCPLWLP